jgi:hypothetical protein
MFNSGFYKVNGKIFFQKVEAIYEANKTKADIEWVFHDEIYEAVDWTVEPQESLQELYKRRAQQLRNKYDYILVFFSGGADSINIVNSFLNNGIHIDEIVAGAPVSGLDNWKDHTNKDAVNTISETRLIQIPLLKEIGEKNPTVKVTIHDYFKDMLEYNTDEWLWKSGSYIHPTFAARYKLERDDYNYLKKIADSGKSIGLIYGIDKPSLIEKDGAYYFMIRDVLVNTAYNSLNHSMAHVELFYYNGDVPELMIKQAHETARFISRPENKYVYDNMHYNSKHIANNKDPWRATWDLSFHTGIFERGIIPAVYPDLPIDMFQANKPRDAFFAQHDDWFPKLHNKTRAWQLMVSDFKNYFKGIDPKYYNFNPITQRPGAFITFRKFYKIGDVSKFKPLCLD